MNEVHKNLILTTVQNNKVVVLTASCGFGKSTMVPPLLSETYSDKKVIVSQPRRIATIQVQKRVSQTFKNVKSGYAVRFDENYTQQTQLIYMTEGILLQLLQNPGFDFGNTILILDEAHELSSNLTLILQLVKKNLNNLFKIVISSATVQVKPFVKYLSGFPLHIDLQSFKVETKQFQESIFEPLKDTISQGAYMRTYLKRVQTQIERLLPLTENNILVFLPGLFEINHLIQTFKHINSHIFQPFHANQTEMFNNRTVYLSTNVAETSLTLPNIDFVVDSGLQRRQIFNTFTKQNELVDEFIAVENMMQRRGRCGRVQNGVYYQMFPLYLLKKQKFEIQISDCSNIILRLLHDTKQELNKLDLICYPDREILSYNLSVLYYHGFIDKNGALTELGLFALKLEFLTINQIKLLFLSTNSNQFVKCAQIIAFLHAFQTQRVNMNQIELCAFKNELSDLETIWNLTQNLKGDNLIKESAQYGLDFFCLRTYFKILKKLEQLNENNQYQKEFNKLIEEAYKDKICSNMCGISFNGFIQKEVSISPQSGVKILKTHKFIYDEAFQKVDIQISAIHVI
ncbi:ATP-dependent_helicase HrpA [Hexamita inflata]|uniref:ATP-dependent helicase HrpA n=1 Tax=Hexamita inflata TaxID=28002 RepID=A0AA86N4E1_9EUKA|nr:ATP-dependent helicase HrpA [Hexamita inflata]